MPIRRELRKFYRGPAWQAARAACRERAGDRCEQCGLSNGTWTTRIVRRRAKVAAGSWPYRTAVQRTTVSKRVKVQCGAAHVNGVAGDDRPENLKWLCRGCHLRHDRPQHKESRATRKDAARPLLQEASL